MLLGGVLTELLAKKGMAYAFDTDHLYNLHTFNTGMTTAGAGHRSPAASQAILAAAPAPRRPGTPAGS